MISIVLCIVIFFTLSSSSAASPSTDPFTPPLFDLILTHDGGVLCGKVNSSSPMIVDLDGNGQHQIVVGTTRNVGSEGGYLPCLAVINANGTLRWSRVLPETANSTAAIADINGDGHPDIVIGVEPENGPNNAGGVIAFDRYGNRLWYYQTGSGSGLPNGVWASPSIIDVNGDGKKEIVFGSWDAKFHLVNGSDGTPFPAPSYNPWPAQMLDTIWSSTAIADLNGDGRPEMVFGGDMTGNPTLCTNNGGLMRSMYDLPGSGPQHSTGYDVVFGCLLSGGNPLNVGLHGLFVDQSLYSSPAIGEFGTRGKLIVVGSGCAWPAGTNCNGNGNGKWVKVWDTAGNQVATLGTDAPVFGSPALADINGDGVLDIVAASMGTGWMDGTGRGGTLYAWSGVSGFPLLWAVKPKNAASMANVRMPSSPIVADLNGDGWPEILVGYVGEIEVFDHNGTQLTRIGGDILWIGSSTVNNSAAVGDLDNNGTMDIVGAGSYCDPLVGTCDNRAHVRAWSAASLTQLSPSASGRAGQSKLPWPMFRREPTHQAYSAIAASLAPIVPSTISLLSPSGSTKSLSVSLKVANTGLLATSYTMSYSQHVSGPASGTIGPNASVTIPISVSPSGLGIGTYKLQASLHAAQGVANGNQTLNINLVIANVHKAFLPMIGRSR